MRHLCVVALGAAMFLSGCVIYPLHGYRHPGDHAAYRDHDGRGDRGRQYDRGQARDGYWHYERGDRP
jgi:hypothetical protein